MAKSRKSRTLGVLSSLDASPERRGNQSDKVSTSTMNAMARHGKTLAAASGAQTDKGEMLSFLAEINDEIEGTFDLIAPNAHLRMALHLLQSHFEAKIVTPTSLIGASGAPYATTNRRLKEMIADGLIEQRPRTRSGKTFSLHPSERLLAQWEQLAGRLRRLAEQRFGDGGAGQDAQDYYFGGSYAKARSIPPLSVCTEPLRLAGGLRVLVHGDPTFMVMDNLKRQFEQVVGAQIHQRAFSIDRLREEALRNAERGASR